MNSPLLKEAKRLYDLGFAIHWLHAKSKRPIESGWTTGPRKEWRHLYETRSEGLNVGVRLGEPSMVGRGYLAVVDVDVKSEEKRHRKEALQAAADLLGDHYGQCPVVVSGRGNGSRHLYCVTIEPFKTWNPAQSQEVVKVLMPSKKPSKAELSSLSEKEIADGWRLSHAWEISLYSDGRQVVLPPSIHPDTGRAYQWVRPLSAVGDLPLAKFEDPAGEKARPGEGKAKASPKEREPLSDVKFPKVDLGWLPISDEVREAIQHGTGVEDRSGYLLRATSALHSAGLSRDEILSALTDPTTFLGACAYEHAGNTTSRRRAAEWLWKFTVKKVLDEKADAVSAFRGLPLPEVSEADDDFLGKQDWRKEIQRFGKDGAGAPKPIIENVVLVLTNEIGPALAKRDLFAYRDTFGLKTPWGAKPGQLVSDDDIVEAKFWISKNFGFEPSNNIVNEAFVLIARKNAYDPVCDWLDALPQWDGTGRLGSWLKEHFEAEGDEEYLNQVFTKWLVAMVMRAYQPGAKFDWMPIFEGSQGVGKSSFGRVLVGDDVFLDGLPNLADKDAALALQGMWGVEMGELANMRKTEIEVVKSFVTRTVDKVRPPYGKRWIESPRRCVFFGTTNRENYLTDDTGNRRMKPLKVGRLDFDRLRADREQLFAEALFLFRELQASGQRSEMYFNLTGEALVYEAKIHAEKMVEDDSEVMVELLEEMIEKVRAENVDFNFEKFRISELFKGGLGRLACYPLNKRNVDLMAKAVKRLGGKRSNNHGKRFWRLNLGGTPHQNERLHAPGFLS